MFGEMKRLIRAGGVAGGVAGGGASVAPLRLWGKPWQIW